MLFVIDIGNTNITMGVYDDEKLKFVARMATEKSKTGDQYAFELINILSIHKVNADDIDGCIVSSVVPVLTNAFKKATAMITKSKTFFVGPGVKTGLNIKIDNPAQLGADLAVGAVAAIHNYSLPCIILDMGTATTISVLDKEGALLGGTICAGIGISLEALNNKTSQLPSISIETPKSVIGRNTIDCMQAGLVIGAAAMIDGLCDRIENQLGEKAFVVATGGLAPEIIKSCNRDIVYNDNLLLEGLRLIYQKNIK